jgi:hypothetical protein
MVENATTRAMRAQVVAQEEEFENASFSASDVD